VLVAAAAAMLYAQAECLNQPDVLEGANLVYCAPTSGGKSMVAEVLMLRRLLSTGRPALLVRPPNSVCCGVTGLL
jgi:DNA polymerase theta